VITLSNTVFLGNLSNYNTNVSSFSPSINIALALSPLSLANGITHEPANLSPHDMYTYKAYIAMNGPSHASVNWSINSTDHDTLGTTISPSINRAILGWNFVHLSCEWCVYICRSPTGTIISSVYINNIFSTTSSTAKNNHFADLLKSWWQISELGPTKFALSIAFSRDRIAHTITLS